MVSGCVCVSVMAGVGSQYDVGVMLTSMSKAADKCSH